MPEGEKRTCLWKDDSSRRGTGRVDGAEHRGGAAGHDVLEARRGKGRPHGPPGGKSTRVGTRVAAQGLQDAGAAGFYAISNTRCNRETQGSQNSSRSAWGREMNRAGRHGRPPSGGPVRSYPERTPFFPVHSGLTALCSLREERNSSFRIRTDRPARRRPARVATRPGSDARGQARCGQRRCGESAESGRRQEIRRFGGDEQICRG